MLSDYATNFALISKETYLVENIIWGNIYQEDEFNTDLNLAIKIDDLAVSIGDFYNESENRFYHEGEPVRQRYEIENEMRDVISILDGTYEDHVTEENEHDA